MRYFLNKHKFLRVVKFNCDKTSTVTYHKIKDFKPDFIIDPNHVFNANGYNTVVITDKSAQTINPLDFESKYDAKMFKTAINSKLIYETFSNLKSPKFDMQQIFLFLSLIANIIILYFILKQNGVF